MPSARTLIVGTAAVAVGFVGLSFAQLGPLDPPAGPIQDTGPDLADLEAQLNALEVSLIQSELSRGPWEVFTAPDFGGLTDRPSSQLIAPGRVLVHSVTITSIGSVWIFDGPGTIATSSNLVTSGNRIAHVRQGTSTQGTSGRSQVGTQTLPLDVVVENGLHAAWTTQGGAVTVTILYRDLPD